MSDRELVRIKKFDVVGTDERGLTAEFSLSRKQAEFVFILGSAVFQHGILKNHRLGCFFINQ